MYNGINCPWILGVAQSVKRWELGILSCITYGLMTAKIAVLFDPMSRDPRHW